MFTVSPAEVARDCGVSLKVLRRWRQEWCKYGEAAFPGYGRRRLPAPSSQKVILRFTGDEYEGLKAISQVRHARSLADFVRAQILAVRQAPSVGEIAGRLDALIAAVRHSAQRVAQAR